MKYAETRAYGMTDADLCQFASDLVGTMTINNVEFTVKWISVVLKIAFLTLVNAFEFFSNGYGYWSDELTVIRP